MIMTSTANMTNSVATQPQANQQQLVVKTNGKKQNGGLRSLFARRGRAPKVIDASGVIEKKEDKNSQYKTFAEQDSSSSKGMKLNFTTFLQGMTEIQKAQAFPLLPMTAGGQGFLFKRQ